MEKIYGHATRVLVWLGDSTKETTLAIAFMKQMLSIGTHFDDLVKGYADQWAALEKLMRMSWFTRRWIVQEIALAKDANIYCGDDEISWTDFCDAVTLFQEHYVDIKPSFLSEPYHFSRNRLGEVPALGACRLVKITSNLFHKSSDGTIQRRLVTLESLISMLTMFNAQEAHDTIYAVIPLAKDIRTVAQKDRSVAMGALPVETPPVDGSDDDFEVVVSPNKKRKTLRGKQSVQRFQHVAREVMPERPSNESSIEPDERRRKGAVTKLQHVVSEVMHTMPSRFRVDYSRSFLRVCMDFVAFAIMQSHSLDVICRPWVPEHLKEKWELPSWLPDVDGCPFRPQADGTFVRVNADPLVGVDAMAPKRYSACGPASRARRVTRAKPDDGWGFGFYHRHSDFKDPGGSHRSMFVTGFILDTIGEVKDKAEDGTIPNDWFKFAGWKDRSQLPPEEFWRTLVANRDSDGSHVGSYYQRTLRDTIQQYGARGSAFNVKAILATPQCDRRSEKVLNRILSVTPNRRLFKTTEFTKHLLGLAPASAGAGDLVCILFGCSVPVVLRRRHDDVDGKKLTCYELLGDAYLHGMMEGDALDEQGKLGIRPQQFELR